MHYDLFHGFLYDHGVILHSFSSHIFLLERLVYPLMSAFAKVILGLLSCSTTGVTLVHFLGLANSESCLKARVGLDGTVYSICLSRFWACERACMAAMEKEWKSVWRAYSHACLFIPSVFFAL